MAGRERSPAGAFRRGPRGRARAGGRVVVVIACAAFLALVLPLAAGDSAPPPAHTVYVSPSGLDGPRCGAPAAPCASFDAAYRRAPAGAVVEIETGVYPQQTLTDDRVRTSAAPVVFEPAPGANVQVDGPLYIFSSHLTLADLHVQDVVIGNYDQTPGRPNPKAVTLRDLSGRDFEIDSATDVTIRGGSWGPTSACGGPYGGGNNSIRQLTGVTPAHIVITGVTIHDVQSYDLERCHIEGLAIFAGHDVTVSHSRFYGDSVYDVFVQANSGPISGLTFKSNWMAMPVGVDGVENGTVIGFSAITSDVRLEDNRFNYIVSLDDDGLRPTYSDFELIDNVGVLPYLGCSLRGITWIHNVWRNSACSHSDISLHGRALPYVDPANDATLNYTLTRSFPRRRR